MSAAATAAGYLYASGRLRGRGAREQEHGEAAKPRADSIQQEHATARKPVRVAAIPAREDAPAERPKRAPRIEYRTRRWRPGQDSHE